MLVLRSQKFRMKFKLRFSSLFYLQQHQNMVSILVAALLIIPSTLISAKPTQSTNQIDYPLYQKVKRNLSYQENLEQRIRLHQKTLLKYNIEQDGSSDENLLVRGGSKKRAPTTGSSFLAGNDLSVHSLIATQVKP